MVNKEIQIWWKLDENWKKTSRAQALQVWTQKTNETVDVASGNMYMAKIYIYFLISDFVMID